MISSETKIGKPVSRLSAAAPKIELMPSQPMQLSQFRRPGMTMLLPYAARASGIWAIPVWGPMVPRIPTRMEPTRLPTRMARTPVTKPISRKSNAASVPMKKAAGTRFGVNQTVKIRPSDP